MIDLADHIEGFEAEVYLPYCVKWLYLGNPNRQEDMEPIDLSATDPVAVLDEAKELARKFMPDDADGYLIELGGIGLHDERRDEAA